MGEQKEENQQGTEGDYKSARCKNANERSACKNQCSRNRQIVVDLVTQSRHLFLSPSLCPPSKRSPPHNRISTKTATIKVMYTRALTSKLLSLYSHTAPCAQGLSSQFNRRVTQFFMMPVAINHFCFEIQYGRLLKLAVFGTTDFTRPNKSCLTEAGNCL